MTDARGLNNRPELIRDDSKDAQKLGVLVGSVNQRRNLRREGADRASLDRIVTCMRIPETIERGRAQLSKDFGIGCRARFVI